MSEINKKYSEDDSSVIFSLTENNLGLDQHNTLVEEVAKEISSGKTAINFDMSSLNSISSSGLGILISCYKKSKENNCRLTLTNLNDKLKNVFKLTKLDNVFEFQTN